MDPTEIDSGVLLLLKHETVNVPAFLKWSNKISNVVMANFGDI